VKNYKKIFLCTSVAFLLVLATLAPAFTNTNSEILDELSSVRNQEKKLIDNYFELNFRT